MESIHGNSMKYYERLATLKNVTLKGIHFHIGSQITKMSVFKSLCSRINELAGMVFST